MGKKHLYNKDYSQNVHNYFGSEFRKYNSKLRLNHAFKLIDINRRDKVLEIGANTGEFTKKLMEYSDNVIGIDINNEAIKDSSLKNIIFMDAEKMQFDDNSFDKIISIHAIEHIPNIDKVFEGIDRLAVSGGEVLLIYPMEIIRGSNAIFDAINLYKNPLKARDLHLHKVTPNKIKKIISGTNLNIKKNCIYFDPYPTFYTVLTKSLSEKSFSS